MGPIAAPPQIRLRALATCDGYALTVNVPSTFYTSNPTYSVQVGINWTSDTNDFDLYVHDSNGNIVCSSGQSMTNFELADCGQLPAGTYTVQIVTFAAVAATYTPRWRLRDRWSSKGRKVLGGWC